ncbi:MAG: YceI family protein [Vicinamibacterales bacterium]
MSLRSVALFTSLLVAPIFAGPRAMGTWTIDAAASHVTILVGKTGLFGFVGHTHEIHAPRLSGTIAFDRDAPGRSVVHLAFEAGALRVDPEGEPPDDVPEVQRTMLGPEVLDVARYPMISFDSTSVDVRPADAAPDDASTTGTDGAERRRDRRPEAMA